MDIIKTLNLEFEYTYIDEKEQEKKNKALKNISLSVPIGQLVAILGHNGCGKSTLAKHFNAVLLPSGGKVYIHDIDTQDESKVYDIRKNVGMVFQNPDNQIVSTIVEEDVAFGLENLGVEPDEIRKRVDDALKTVEMFDYRKHAPHQLSGGQKQRIAIAGIIAMRPKCIVLDEPTAMLDPQGRKEVIKTIRKLNKNNNITIINITHYMEEAALCDRVVVMNEGKILLDDTPSEVFSRVDILKEVGLDVPQATELIYELNKCGFNLDNHIITEDACADALDKLLKSGGNNAGN